MPKDENGLINNAHGFSFEEFKWLKAKQKESEQKGLVDVWKVPSTTYLHPSYKFGFFIYDRSMKRFFYLFIQFTWGLGQSIIGFSFFLRHFRCPHRMYRGAIETQWNSKYSGLSLGPFIFTPTNPDENYCTGVRTHEYGHTIQSLILGPLYAIVGIISVVWGSLIHPMLRKKTKEEPKYTACFVEYNASWLGEKVTGEKAAW